MFSSTPGEITGQVTGQGDIASRTYEVSCPIVDRTWGQRHPIAGQAITGLADTFGKSGHYRPSALSSRKTANFTKQAVGFLQGAIPTGPSYKLAGPFRVGSNPYSAAVGNLNLDGTPDIVVSNCFSNNTGVLLSGTQIAVPYTGLSLVAGHSIQAAYTPDSGSKYGSSSSPATIAP
jgi:hypothetical protein